MDAADANAEGARRRVEAIEAELLDLSVEAQRADWVYSTHITDDTEALAARAQARLIRRTVELAKSTVPLSQETLPVDLHRKIRLVRLSLSLVAPDDPREAEELTGLVASMTGLYGKGRFTPSGASAPLDLQGLSRIVAESRRPDELRDVWKGWHAVARPMRPKFTRYVELANRGAAALGFEDMGAMWRSKYDMEPPELEREVDRLWAQVRPLYDALHAFVRTRLRAQYGDAVVPSDGPIPAHLLGNMWAQTWDNLLPLLGASATQGTEDLSQRLRARGTTPVDLVRIAERFFVSLGLDPLPSTFWERSMFEKPRDREVVCHASAWDLDYLEDLRIKMCVEITEEDFGVVHHELGHNYYQRAYRGQPFLYRDGAHDGFHEAIGDTIGLSVTPGYLRQIGLADTEPGPEAEVALLLKSALVKVAFLPFGLAIDRWRWRVFSGAVSPGEYTRSWWELREELQGVAPPEPRGEEEFDPGAKYHVPANVPYLRYFLADILQFQFHRALARSVGWEGPLHGCSIYARPEAGRRLASMLALGQSRPWPEALEALTGERRMDASALLEYYAPLRRWLDEANRGAAVGW